MVEQSMQIQNFPQVKVKIAIRFRVCEIWVQMRLPIQSLFLFKDKYFDSPVFNENNFEA